jgi:hypothetical protein
MAGDHIDVRPADLVAHAAAIEAVAGEVATARQAGDAVRLDVGAYGKLCTIVPALLNGLSGVLVDGIDTAAQSLRDTGARLRTAAGGYQASDEQAAAMHRRIRDAL